MCAALLDSCTHAHACALHSAAARPRAAYAIPPPSALRGAHLRLGAAAAALAGRALDAAAAVGCVLFVTACFLGWPPFPAPVSHWLTCLAKRSEQRVSCELEASGATLTIMSVLPWPERHLPRHQGGVPWRVRGWGPMEVAMAREPPAADGMRMRTEVEEMSWE
jgi:hypothetical protein